MESNIFDETDKDCSLRQMNSIAEGVCKEYSKLSARLQEFQPKRHKRRITNLACPRNIMSKVVPSNNQKFDIAKKTEIIRELPIMTRTEQLAYPCVRKMLPIRKDFKSILGDRRLEVFNRTIRKSLLSLYSRLANCQPPEERKTVCKWTDKEWAVHRRYLCKLAKPKKNFKPPKQVHMWKDIQIMDRFKYLCNPKKRLEEPITKWQLTAGLKKYKPTPIIIRLSKPKEIDESILYQTLPVKIPSTALMYKPTDRILQLATRAEKRLGESDLKENPFGVAANALKAKPSERIVELSQAREFEEGHVRQNPFLISPAALKAKPTPRIIELAQPKGSA